MNSMHVQCGADQHGHYIDQGKPREDHAQQATVTHAERFVYRWVIIIDHDGTAAY